MCREYATERKTSFMLTLSTPDGSPGVLSLEPSVTSYKPQLQRSLPGILEFTLLRRGFSRRQHAVLLGFWTISKIIPRGVRPLQSFKSSDNAAHSSAHTCSLPMTHHIIEWACGFASDFSSMWSLWLLSTAQSFVGRTVGSVEKAVRPAGCLIPLNPRWVNNTPGSQECG